VDRNNGRALQITGRQSCRWRYPGWLVKINLAGTGLDGQEFEPTSAGLNGDDHAEWYAIKVENNRFVGAGDPAKLGFILDAFLCRAESRTGPEPT
jgi:hypothetical protein